MFQQEEGEREVSSKNGSLSSKTRELEHMNVPQRLHSQKLSFLVEITFNRYIDIFFLEMNQLSKTHYPIAINENWGSIIFIALWNPTKNDTFIKILINFVMNFYFKWIHALEIWPFRLIFFKKEVIRLFTITKL